MTWEPLHHLEGVIHLVEQFEMERKREVNAKAEADKKAQEKQMRRISKLGKSKPISKAGSLDKGDKIDKVIGFSTGKQASFGFSCKVKWQPKKSTSQNMPESLIEETPTDSFVALETLRDSQPYKLLQYFENYIGQGLEKFAAEPDQINLI